MPLSGCHYRRTARWLLPLLLLLLLASPLLRHRRAFLPHPPPSPHPPLPLPLPSPAITAAAAAGWPHLLPALLHHPTPHLVVEAKNGLGNRLRALASAMAVAARLRRPLVLVWLPDLHCNCSFGALFAPPHPFALCEAAVDAKELSPRRFQLYNYMRPEPGAVKDAPVVVDEARHLWFKSGFVMNHPFGHFRHAQAYLQQLPPVRAVADRIVASRAMVGLHIRNVFDAPRDAATQRNTTGRKALHEATREYGAEGTLQLLRWRKAGHWSNFVPKIREMVAEDEAQRREKPGAPPLRFYLAADSAEAYTNLKQLFADRLVFTERSCPAERCDFRDCTGMLYSLVDMANLARTRLILGSGWSSYSEVAAYMGGADGRPLTMLMAGRDFGQIARSEPQLKPPTPAAVPPRVQR